MRTLLPLVLLTACSAPSQDGFFVQLDVRTAVDETQAAAELISVVDSAQKSLQVAMPYGEDTSLPMSIVAAHEAGVDVEVVTDIDSRPGEGIQLMLDAGVPIRFADGELTYFDFSANRDVSWSSTQVLMSDAFVIADRLRIANATSVGRVGGGAQVVFQASNEDLAADLWLEHNQLFGGSDATALTAFSAPAKSQADVRWVYPTSGDAVYELWFGPQERIIKRVIDAVYTARRSVRVMSNEVANDGMARALQDKASWGFDVQLIVGPEFGSTLTQLADQVTQQTPGVQKYRFTEAPDLPTVILIDIEGADGDLDVLPRAFVISHDLYSASRFFENRTGALLEVTTDQVIDGNLSVITDEDHRYDPATGTHSDPASQLAPLIDLYLDHLARSGDF